MKVLCIVLLLSTLSSFSLGWHTKPEVVPAPVQHDSAAKIIGKSAATTAVATFTGGVLLATLRVCKWADALNSNFSFFAIGAALLYCQHKIVSEVIGDDYTFPSVYTSLVTMLGMAGAIIYHNDI